MRQIAYWINRCVHPIFCKIMRYIILFLLISSTVFAQDPSRVEQNRLHASGSAVQNGQALRGLEYAAYNAALDEVSRSGDEAPR